MPKPSEYQEKVRQANRMHVLSFLKEGKPIRFGELKDLSKLSPMGLSKILKDLEGDKLVKHYLSGSWPVYEITKKGSSSLSNSMTLGIMMDQIEKSGGEYYHNYSGIKTSMGASGLSWGIQDDVVINNDLEKEISVILSELIIDIQKNIYQKIKEISKIKKIDLSKIKDDKIILGFILEYAELLKSINENSLETYQNMHKGRKPTGKFTKASKEFAEFDKI